jgi:membrane protein YdbS with pleckstrin-like domain
VKKYEVCYNAFGRATIITTKARWHMQQSYSRPKKPTLAGWLIAAAITIVLSLIPMTILSVVWYFVMPHDSGLMSVLIPVALSLICTVIVLSQFKANLPKNFGT